LLAKFVAGRWLVDPGALSTYVTLADFDNAHIYSTVQAAVDAFRASPVDHPPARA